MSESVNSDDCLEQAGVDDTATTHCQSSKCLNGCLDLSLTPDMVINDDGTEDAVLHIVPTDKLPSKIDGLHENVDGINHVNSVDFSDSDFDSVDSQHCNKNDMEDLVNCTQYEDPDTAQQDSLCVTSNERLSNTHSSLSENCTVTLNCVNIDAAVLEPSNTISSDDVPELSRSSASTKCPTLPAILSTQPGCSTDSAVDDSDALSEVNLCDDGESQIITDTLSVPSVASSRGNSPSRLQFHVENDPIVQSILNDDDVDDFGDSSHLRSSSHRSSVTFSTDTKSATFRTPACSVSDANDHRKDADVNEEGDSSDFVEISLRSSNSLEDKDTQAEQTTDNPASKRTSLTSFFSRSLALSRSSASSETANDSLGWKLFGKVTPKGAAESDKPCANSLESNHNQKLPCAKSDTAHAGSSTNDFCSGKSTAVIRSDKEVPSTTALILEHRPEGLPTKSQDEIIRHQMMYDQMVEAARKKEKKDAKLRKKRIEQQRRHDEQMCLAVRIWNVEILPNWDLCKATKKTRDLWWNGLPPSVRGNVWKLAIGNDLNVTSELYEICLLRAQEKLKILQDPGASADTDSLSSFTESSGNREASVELIKLDVSRTFPQLCIFQQGGPYHQTLQGLLGAYACYRPDVGYVQGMSFIAAVLLLNMDEVDTFICFANLLNKPCEVAFFRLDENLMKAYFQTYELFFKENLPRLFAHFTALQLSPDIYIIDWMYTLFAKSLPLDVASRVWDVFCRDGEEFLFRTALGILRMYEDILLRLDFIHLAQFLTRLPDNISDIELFDAIASIRMSTDKLRFAQVFAGFREHAGR